MDNNLNNKNNPAGPSRPSSYPTGKSNTAPQNSSLNRNALLNTSKMSNNVNRGIRTSKMSGAFGRSINTSKTLGRNPQALNINRSLGNSNQSLNINRTFGNLNRSINTGKTFSGKSNLINTGNTLGGNERSIKTSKFNSRGVLGTGSQLNQYNRPSSPEEKLKKSMKGLSYTGSGSSNLDLNPSAKLHKQEKTNVRKKVGGVVLDVETIHDANKQKFETKGRRNNVVILILSLLLVVSLIYLALAFISYKNSKRSPNLKFFVQGEAQWVIEGGTNTEMVMENGYLGGQMYTISSKLNITTTDSVTLYIEIKVLHKGEEILISGLQEAPNFVRVKDTNKFVYNGSITGGGIIQVFGELDFSENEQSLNTEDLVIEITAYVEKLM